MHGKSIVLVAAVLAFAAGYILGGALIYREAPSASHAYEELGAGSGEAPPAYEGLVKSARNATVEGHAVVEGHPRPVVLGHARLPLIDGVVVVPEPGMWKVEGPGGRERTVCHMKVVESILTADKARAEGEVVSWYIEGHGWEKVLVAEHVTVWRNGLVEEMEHEHAYCSPVHGGHGWMHEHDDREHDS